MAEKFLEDIYRYSKVITMFRKVVEYLRLENSHYAFLLMKEQKEAVCDVCRECIESGYSEGNDIWENVKYIYEEEGDSIVRADILENAIIPMMEKCVQSMGNISQQMDEEYVIESTSSGFLTMKNLRVNKYMHSNNDPMAEARRQMNEYYVPSAESYAVLGCGLGYQIYQLYLISRGSVPIRVYERNPQIIEYARNYGVLDWVPEELLEIHIEEDVVPFLEDVSEENIGSFMHLPSIICIENEVERNAMLEAYGQWHTRYVHKRDFSLNFWRNIHSDAKLISELNSDEVKDEVVVVAAGPSLDDSLEQLRTWKDKKTIIAVGTVFVKLLQAGIRPDYVAVLDPQKRTLKQIQGVEEENIPMILDASAYWGFARNYQGPKYLVFTDTTKDVADYAILHHIDCWPIGGTVTSLAIEFAIHFHAKIIYMIGVDLAFPGGVTHATGTMDRKQTDTEGMRKIPGVLGQTVYSDNTFRIYIQWLENCIARRPYITWYNLSTKGARLKGAIEVGHQAITEELVQLPSGKISVIIPCYNVEAYIRQCAESLIAQTLPEEMLELIFVDDASTDSTWKILQEYAEQYGDRVKIHRLPENSRQGAARNAGLQMATGNFIGFADADDYVDAEMYSILYRAACNTNSDEIICGRYEEYPDGTKRYLGPKVGGILDMSKEEYANEVIGKKAPSGAVQRLYKREFLDKIKIKFPEKITYEDNYYIGISNYYLRTVTMVSLPLYHYRIHPESTVQKRNSLHHLDRLKIEIMKVEELKRRGAFQYNQTDAEMQFLKLYFVNTIMILAGRFDEIPEGILWEMQKAVKKLFPKWKENVLLQDKKYAHLREICSLIDYPFKRGDHEELLEVLTEKGLWEETNH